MYYFLYKITNLIDGKIYIGVHKTKNVDDNYMGSSKWLKSDIKFLGIKNFKKEILEYFDDQESMYKKEREIVNENFITRLDTYNHNLGGSGNSWKHCKGMITVYDKNGNYLNVKKDDPRYLSGELKFISSNKITVKDKLNNTFRVSSDDPRYLSGELVGVTKGKTLVKDKNNRIFLTTVNDDKIGTELELYNPVKGKVTVKDKNGNTLSVFQNDPRYLSGELVPYWKGKKHTNEVKERIGSKNSIHQKGEGNSQFGTCWIFNKELKENKKVKKENIQEWLDKGWIKGRKQKI